MPDTGTVVPEGFVAAAGTVTVTQVGHRKDRKLDLADGGVSWCTTC
jgi:hypothetical protein